MNTVNMQNSNLRQKKGVGWGEVGIKTHNDTYTKNEMRWDGKGGERGQTQTHTHNYILSIIMPAK